MISLNRRTQAIAVALAMLAGFSDAIGFVELGGFFVSFMSGNSTRFGVGIVAQASAWQIALGLISAFLGGVTIGSLLGRKFRVNRERRMILSVAATLATAALVAGSGHSLAAALIMAMAMGMENTVFERGGSISFGLTYMTGAVVKVGQLIAAYLAGEPASGIIHYLLLWMALVGGAICGAWAHGQIGLAALWFAAAGAALISLCAPSSKSRPT